MQQKPLTPGPRSRTKGRQSHSPGHPSISFGCRRGLFLQEEGQLPQCKAKEKLEVAMKLSRGPAWHPLPQVTAGGDTPESGAPPRSSSGAVGGQHGLFCLLRPARGSGSLGPRPGEERARRRLWAGWGCGRCGAHARSCPCGPRPGPTPR